jgi:NDP-sugar pyrophosphorylase family protein
MKGMILAAGFGTRLGNLTNDTPKALIEYRGKPLIARQIEKLKRCDADEIVINAHHHSEQIFKHFERNDYGIKITVLKEDEILGTGGGIINAGKILSKSENSIIVNTDIETDFDFREIIHHHERKNNFITILIQKRITSRYLKFTPGLDLISRSDTGGKAESDYAFNGVHIISKKFFEITLQTGFADIIDIYLELTGKGYTISGYNAGNTNFKDIGKPENLI